MIPASNCPAEVPDVIEQKRAILTGFCLNFLKYGTCEHNNFEDLE